jgi:tetratricopeptide (TPR) repeat protein
MKHFFIFLIALLFASPLLAQKTTYSEWKEEAKIDIALLPKYGGAEKTDDQKKADSILISTAIAEKRTPREASDYFVKLGFDYLAKGDSKTAMYRFNQAWLIDAKNENVFWGYGGVYFSFGDHEQALLEYTEGLVINPKSANIMVDMATIGMSRFSKSKDLSELSSSISLLTRAYEIAPTNQNLLFKLSVCYFFKDDCANATKYYDECMKLGGKPITASYTAGLKAKCKN